MPNDRAPESICLLIPTMDGAGTERAMLILANYWARNGTRVTLVLFRRTGALLGQLDTAIEVVDLDCANALQRVLRLKKFLAERRPPVLLSALNPANAVAVIAARLAGGFTQVIASVHNHLGAKYANAPSVLNPLRKAFIGWVLRKASGVVCVSLAIRSYVCKELGVQSENAVTIYNPLELAKWNTPAKRPEGMSVQADRRWLIAVGRLTQQKRFDVLVDAMALLPANHRLAILGEGESRAALEGQIQRLQLQERVLLAGFQEQPQAWFQHADCFVLSSDWEGFPFVLLEALACGLPIVATDCPSGPAELILDVSYGRLAPCNNPAALAQVIRQMLSHPRNREACERRAMDFTAQRVIEHYNAAIAKVTRLQTN